MLKQSPVIKKVAVLGAGVMGAQIAAHFANAGIQALLFDLPAQGTLKSAVAIQAIAALRKLKPPPLALAADENLLQACNYDDDLDLLTACQLVIEAIAERLDWKHQLYEKISPFLNPDCIIASNTSGISIKKLALGFQTAQRSHFVGVHFFNPPRYMQLVELIPHDTTAPDILDQLESFLVGHLGKGVVRARDTANFIGNRIGIFAMMVTLHHAQRLKLNFETVDALTGTKIGRPKSATFRTADVVGLDTMLHVLRGAMENLADDPWADVYHIPDWLQALVDAGKLGQKTRCGVYKKEKDEILVYVPETQTYRKRYDKIPSKVEKILAKRHDPERLTKLRALNDPCAEFLWCIHRDVFHYAAFCLQDIAETTRDIDFAVRWGFGWKMGVFETWQAAGWRTIAASIREDIAAGKTLTTVPLPDWVDKIDHAFVDNKAWSAEHNIYIPRSSLPVYQRQRCLEPLQGDSPCHGTTIFETDATRCWHAGNDIVVISFKTKMHTIGDPVIADLNRAIDETEAHFKGLVIWQEDAPFSAGADLKAFMPVVLKDILPGIHPLDELLQRFQNICCRMRHSDIPVVAGVQGLALGGGCELLMQCDRVVATLESYIGLVEVGVGLIPAGSGCMELARRASIKANGGDVFPYLKDVFETVAMGKVAGSAKQAREMGFLRETDVIVMNSREVLYAALAQVEALHAAHYRPEPSRLIQAGGRAAAANFKAAMVNMHAGQFISDYDLKIGQYVAAALCGGDIDTGMKVDEAWFLKQERLGFGTLVKNPKTHARVMHTLNTGKPLRN